MSDQTNQLKGEGGEEALEGLASEQREPTDGASSEDALADVESHRALVREINRKIGAIYGYGGAVAFGSAGATAGLLGWWRGFWGLLPWSAAVVAFLVVMLVLRAVLARVADSEYERLVSYCEANELTVDQMRAHFGGKPAFQYFEALFEIRERRAAAGRGGDGGPEADGDAEAGNDVGQSENHPV